MATMPVCRILSEFKDSWQVAYIQATGNHHPALCRRSGDFPPKPGPKSVAPPGGQRRCILPRPSSHVADLRLATRTWRAEHWCATNFAGVPNHEFLEAKRAELEVLQKIFETQTARLTLSTLAPEMLVARERRIEEEAVLKKRMEKSGGGGMLAGLMGWGRR
jgi:hypothetical protein